MSDLYDPQDDVRAEALEQEEYRTVNCLAFAETLRSGARYPKYRWVSKLLAALTACAVMAILSGCATPSGYGQQTTTTYGPNGYTQTMQGYSQPSGMDCFAQGLALVTPYVMPFVYNAAYGQGRCW